MKTKFYIFALLFAVTAFSTTAQTQLWGTTQSGGATGQGTIFSTDATGTHFYLEYSLVNALGQMPNGSPVLANNGKLYGVTELGGYGDSCVVYSYEPVSGTFTDIHDLYQYTQFGWEAKSGMMKAEDGTLYGLCAMGGANGSGVIYKVNPYTDTYTDIFDFSSSSGTMPYGGLIQLLDGKLYGMTQSGGANNAGVIFGFDPESPLYTKLYDFDYSTGGNPTFGKLMLASDGKLYGTTQGGGANNAGVIFSFDLSTGTYTKLYNFDVAGGGTPNGSLVQAANGMLYGTTNLGGANGSGVIFSFDLVNGTYVDLHDFNGINGAQPKRGLTLAANGLLYGTTYAGGTSGSGVAFNYDITGATYTKLVDFNSSTTGSNPDCELIETPMLTTTGIAVLPGKSGVAIGPNPATTNYLTLTGTDREDIIQFTDVLGKEIALIKVSAQSKKTIDISDFPNVFFAKGNNTELKKIVKE